MLVNATVRARQRKGIRCKAKSTLPCSTGQCRALPNTTVPVPCGTIDLASTVVHGISKSGIPGEWNSEEVVVGTRGKVYNEWMDRIGVFEFERAYLEAAVTCLMKEF